MIKMRGGMAYKAQKTEHVGAKKGCGAYWGRKKDAKNESKRQRREVDKTAPEQELEEWHDAQNQDNEWKE